MITVVGEILVDLIERAPGHIVAHPGGSPANVAVGLARLGQAVNLLTQLGDDAPGQLLLAHLRNNGVELAPGSLLDCPRTSTALANLTADGHASYGFDFAWQRFPALATIALDATVTCVHTGSLATVLAPGAEDVAELVRAARQTATVSFDPNCRPSLVDDPQVARNRIGRLVASSDIVKASLDDLRWLYPRRAYQDIGHEWLDLGPGIVVVTMGSDGAWACTRSGESTVDAWPVEVVDTVGAGDAFTAGLLSALTKADLLGTERRAALRAIDGVAVTEVLLFASRVASVTCGRRGADPPTMTDLLSAPD